MATQNPYHPPQHQGGKPSRPRPWCGLLIGFAVGALPPLALGVRGWYSFESYVASLPPGTAVCGNGMLGVLLLIFFVAPVTGSAGALVGWGIASWRR